MDFLEFVISSVTLILKSFVPGYISVYLYRYLRTTKADTFERTVIHSVVISYLLTTLVDFCCKDFINQGMMTDKDAAVSVIILACVAGVGCALLRNWAFVKKALEKVGRITGSESIWEDLFDLERGSELRCTTQFHNVNVSIRGDVKYFEPTGDGDCNIVLEDYEVKNLGQKQLYKPKVQARMLLNTKNISSVEVTYGKKRGEKSAEDEKKGSADTEENKT